MNKIGKAKELTLGGTILLIIIGIIFLSQSGSDSTGTIFWMGLIFLIVGIVGLVSILISYFR